MSSRGDLVLAIHPIHAESILSGRKAYEVRSRFPSVALGSRVYLYATAPVSAVVGGFEVGEIVEGDSSFIWENLGDNLCVSKGDFESYALGRGRLKAVQVVRPFRLTQQVTRSEMKDSEYPFTPPQSSSFLSNVRLRTRLEGLTA
jgi:predicted transcriptional regulator